MAGTFRALKKELLKNLKSGKAYKKELSLLNEETWGKRFGDDSKDDVLKLVKGAVKESLALLGEGWDDYESDFEKMIAEATKDSTSKISETINYTHEDLKKMIQKILAENPLATPEELMKLLREGIDYKFDTWYTEERARMIAQTTSTFAIGAAQEGVWADEMGMKLEWVSSRDKDVRLTHRQADGTQRDKKGYFTVGTDRMRHPGGGTVAKENVNCRCGMFPVRE